MQAGVFPLSHLIKIPIMNNHRLLTGLLAAALCSAGVCANGQARQILTIEELFEIAESNSAQLRPSFAAEEEARRGIEVARSRRLPDIDANLSFSYIGDGFTTKRNFSDYQRAPIPHFGNTFGINISQPIYTGGAINAGIEIAELKSTAARYANEMERDNIRFRLAGFYLDIYKCYNLRGVVENNITQTRKTLEEMRARYEQGVALQNDITRGQRGMCIIKTLIDGIYCTVYQRLNKRSDRDSNSGSALDAYTLSRRASSATRASLLR